MMIGNQMRYHNLWRNTLLPEASYPRPDPSLHRSLVESMSTDFSMSQTSSPNSASSSSSSTASKKSRKRTRLLPNCDDVTIFPRRKAGQDKLGSNRPPIVITRQVLESHFNMPQQQVCKKLGICATVIKKVCRQLGIEKWPFKGNKIILRKQGLAPPKKNDKDVPADTPAIPSQQPSSVASPLAGPSIIKPIPTHLSARASGLKIEKPSIPARPLPQPVAQRPVAADQFPMIEESEIDWRLLGGFQQSRANVMDHCDPLERLLGISSQQSDTPKIPDAKDLKTLGAVDAVEEDDQSFDLSWLVSPEQARIMNEIDDRDMFDRFKHSSDAVDVDN